MVRRTLEGLCIDHACKKQLVAALEDLRDRGIIEGRLFEWAQALRVLGNVGAHYSETTVTRQDALDALALTEAILDYVYILGRQFEEFQSRRNREEPEIIEP